MNAAISSHAVPEDLGPEVELQCVTPYLFHRFPLRMAAFFLIAILGLWLFVLSRDLAWEYGQWLGIVSVAYIVARLFIWWLGSRRTQFTVTNRRLFMRSGVLGREQTNIPLEDIDDVRVRKQAGPMGIRVGDLQIRWHMAAQSRVLVVIAVPYPDCCAAYIRNT